MAVGSRPSQPDGAVGRLLRVQPRLVRVGAVAGGDHLRHEARALGVGLEDRGLRRVLDHEEDVRVGRLQPLHLGGQRGGAGLGRQVGDDLVAALLGQVERDLPVVLAEEVVAGEERDGLEIGGPAVGRPLLEELEHARHHGAVVGPGAIEPLEALLGERGRGAGVAAHRDAVAVHERLDDRGVAARALAVEPVDLVHGDELLGECPGLVTAALVVAHDQGHLGAAETGEALAGAERHLQIRVVVVDDVLHGLPGPEVLLAQAREVAGERKQLADEHLGDGAGGPDSRVH